MTDETARLVEQARHHLKREIEVHGARDALGYALRAIDALEKDVERLREEVPRRGVVRRLELRPDGWPIPLRKCPPGPFTWITVPGPDHLGWMSEYGDNDGRRHAYNIAGEHIDWKWADATVQPLEAVWTEDDE